jgi:hypothetical protein
MPVPWLHIVQLVPAILDVSRELLRKTQKPPAPALKIPGDPGIAAALAERVAALEANERRQAELVNQIAQQVATLSEAVTVLHRRLVWASWIGSIALALMAIALAMGIARSA